METIYVDLMLDTGELVRIEAPADVEDDLYESLEHAMKCGDWWSPVRFYGCKARLLGVDLNRVAMRRVVGML